VVTPAHYCALAEILNIVEGPVGVGINKMSSVLKLAVQEPTSCSHVFALQKLSTKSSNKRQGGGVHPHAGGSRVGGRQPPPG